MAGKHADKPRVVIRRRGGGHEGDYHGAWKIALADFMTTMMALFLVLWVIATATPEQRRGLSEYFSTPLAEAIAGGNKETASDSAIPGGGPDPMHNEGERADIHIRAQTPPKEQNRRLRHLKDRIAAAIAADKTLQAIQNQLRFEMTPEGLRIEMVDTDQRPMFELGSDVPEPYTRDLLKTLAPLLNELPNQLAIYGHTDSRPYPSGDKGYSNWELSADRANASRRELVADGLDTGKLLVVSGVADRIPLANSQPTDANNRRIEIMVLTAQAAQNLRMGVAPPAQQ